jgi:hypothetical protein
MSNLDVLEIAWTVYYEDFSESDHLHHRRHIIYAHIRDLNKAFLAGGNRSSRMKYRKAEGVQCTLYMTLCEHRICQPRLSSPLQVNMYKL